MNINFSKNDLVEIVRLSTQDELSSRAIASLYNCSKSSINYFLSRKTYLPFWEEFDKKPVAGGNVIDPILTRKPAKAGINRFIVTSAQTNTFVHRKFWASLLNCALLHDAEILVSTFSYNKHAFQNDGEDWVDPLIVNHISNDSLQLAKGLVWCGELNIIPTAVNPISGLNNYTGVESCIMPHAKQQLESVATAKHHDAKLIYTTGCCTQSNYIERKAGQKAAHHHIYGALMVEIDSDGTWFVRQLHASTKTGVFHDLDMVYTPDDVYSEDILAISWGDIHKEKLDHQVGLASFGIYFDPGVDGYPNAFGIMDSCMLNVLRPEYQFFHDISDFTVRNHHNRNDPLFRIKMYRDKTEEVRAGIEDVGDFLYHTSRYWCKSIVVKSNHDTALDKWATECDWKHDPVNAQFLLECQLAMVIAINGKAVDFDLFESSTKAINGNIDNVRFLKLDESFTLGGEGGIECGSHGHNGSGGARGSTQTYRVAGVRYTIGHQHAAGMKDGVCVGGVSAELDMGYNVGLSNWSHTHVLTYKSLKRALVTIKNGKWRAMN